MGKYDTDDLKKGDIVVVEMTIVRWAPKETDGAGKKAPRKRREWKKWNVDFRLEAVSVIYPGSDYADEAEDQAANEDDFAA